MTEFRKILEMGSERAVADLALKAMEDDEESLPEILALCFLEEYPLSMRASRVAQLFCGKYPESIYPYLDEIVPKVMVSTIDGVKRNFLKIIAEFIDIGKISNPVVLMNQCFEWMMDSSQKPAVRVFSMEILYRFAEDNPYLLNELKASLEIIMDESPACMKARGKKIIRKIYKEVIPLGG